MSTLNNDNSACEVDVLNDVVIETPSGELAADVVLPRSAPAAALITLLPYNKDWFAGLEWRRLGLYFAAHGYASVLVDFRGTGGSTGSLRPPFAADEADDGVAVVEWAARQEWCNGNVGMWGLSYGAITALRTATLRPPGLKAIAAFMGHLDPERDFVHPNGHRGFVAPLAWALFNLQLQLLPPRVDDGDRWRRVWSERLEKAEPYLIDLVQRRPGDPTWRTRAIDARDVDVPSFCVVGWRDLFVDGMMRAFAEIPAPKRLLAGPWMHVLPDMSPTEPIDVLPMLLDWWRRWLTTSDVEDSAPQVSFFVQGADRWRAADSWPPSEASAKTFSLTVDGRLIRGEEAEAGTVQLVPDATVGVNGGLGYFQSGGFGAPADQSSDEARTLTFTTEPLDAELTLAGSPRMRITLTESLLRIPLVVKLSDVGEALSVPITTGVSSVFADSDWIEFSATAYRIPRGHRLRLTIAVGDFPRLWPCDVGTQTIACGQGLTSVEIPVLPLEGGTDIDLPASDPDALVPSGLIDADEPTYEVSRQPEDDSATVTIARRFTFRSADGVSVAHYAEEFEASVEARAPSTARLSGTTRADIETPAGAITVSAEMTATQHGVAARGEVVMGEEVLFARDWSA